MKNLCGCHSWSDGLAGVRTETHRLIYLWKKDQWECYDLAADPEEMHNIYNDPHAQNTVAMLKQELWLLKKELKDDDQFAYQQPKIHRTSPRLRLRTLNRAANTCRRFHLKAPRI
jgi:arylsulfatase A-like enzyme